MKKLLFLFVFIFSINGFSGELDGISSIPDGVKSFFDPLKKGYKHIDEAISNIPSLSSASRTYSEAQVHGNGSGDLTSQLKTIMGAEQQGGVVSYKEVDSREKLNGSYVVKTFSVKFAGGKSRTMEFKFLKPTINGNFHFVDAQIVD